MKVLLFKSPFSVLLILLLQFSPILAQSSWEIRNNGLPEWSTAWCIDASDSSNAIISISSGMYPDTSGIYKTSDGGNNWVKLHPPLKQFESIIDISLKSEDLIWTATGNGRIIHSDDGGAAWTIQFDDTSLTDFMNYIEMFDEQNGVALGDPKIIPGSPSPFHSDKPSLFLKTTNGGLNWIQLTDSILIDRYSGDTWRRVDFSDPLNGYLIGSQSGIAQEFYKTNDGALNWTKINKPLSSSVLLKCYDENLVLSVYYSGSLKRTNDGGETWNSFPQPAAGYPEDFEFIPGDAAKVFLIGDADLFFSNDTAKTWTKVLYNNSSSISGWDIVFTDTNHGWILGDSGRVYKTNNGGAISDYDGSHEIPLPVDFVLYQNYPNPFNPETIIKYRIPENGFVTLKVYDILGKEIITLINEEKPIGKYEVNYNAAALSSGVYIYKLKVNEYSSHKKMILMK